MKVLITGPRGYLATAMRNKADIDFIYEKNAYGDIIETDITHSERFLDFDYDVIIHNAGIVGTTNCIKSPYAVDVNVNGTANMIKVSRKKNVPIIFLSTSVVYKPTRLDIKEDSLKEPQTLYGKTKYLGELMLRELSDKFIIVRPCMIFGPNDKHSAITMAMAPTKDNPKTIYLDPQYYKPYLHIDEFVKGMEIIIKNHKKLLGEDINFAPEKHHKVRDILDYVYRITKRKNYKLVKKHDYLGDHILTDKKIKRLTGWKQKHSLQYSICKTYKEMK